MDLGRFADLMATPRPRLDLALALIAAAERPQVDPDGLVAALDDLASAVSADDAEGICGQLFDPKGPHALSGDRADYYDPRNSELDQVLARRRGIPITLSVVAMEVGRRKGVHLEGIGMPGHFLVGDRTRGRFFDAFDGGRPLDPDGARSLFHQLHGVDQPFESAYLAPTSPTMIVVRVLNNLRAAHLRRGDRRGLAAAIRLQTALPGSSLQARRDLAGVLAADGRFVDAAAVHDSLAEDDLERADEHRRSAVRLRARLN